MKLQKALLAASLVITIFSCKKDQTKDINQADWDFIQSMSYRNSGEVDLSSLARNKANADTVKGFATKLNVDHQSAKDDLQYLANLKGVSISSTDTTYPHLKNELTATSGRAFDSTFLHIESTNQQALIDLMQNEITNGHDQNIMSYTNSYLPLIRKHKQTADSIIAALNY